MTRRTGVTRDAHLRELEHTLAMVRAELENLEHEHARYRRALVQIANAESGVWGWTAHDALHPPKDDEGVA